MTKVYICGDGFLAKELYKDFNSDIRYKVSNQIPGLKRPFLLDSKNFDLFSRKLSDQQNSIFINASGPSNVQESFESIEESVDQPSKQVSRHMEMLALSPIPITYVYISSAAVYGETTLEGVREDASLKPMSPYAEGKLRAEETLSLLGKHPNSLVSVIILRVFSAYSENLEARILHKIAVSSRQKQHFDLAGDGKESRDFVHSTDISRVIKFLVEKEEKKEGTFNVGSGIAIKLHELMVIADKVYADIYKERLDYSFDGRKRVGDPVNLVANIDKLTRKGFIPQVIPTLGLENYFLQAFRK